MNAINVSDIREMALPWQAQVLLFFLFSILYPIFAAGVFVLVPNDSGGIVAGSIFGGYPIFLRGIVNALKKPHVDVVEKTNETSSDKSILCRYPHRVYVQNPSLRDQEGNDLDPDVMSSVNAARAIITLKNKGWGTATKCRVWVCLKEINTEKDRKPRKFRFPVRWEREDNPLRKDLKSGESEEVNLFEIDLFSGGFKTALSHMLTEDARSTQNEYDTVKRYEIKPDTRYRVSVVITSDEMATIERPINFKLNKENSITISNTSKNATRWWIIDSLLDTSNRAFAAWYREDGNDIIYYSDNFDLNWLRHAEPVAEPETQKPYLPDYMGDENQSYRDVLEKRGFIIKPLYE